MANASVKIRGKCSQYALQILDFTHEILGPVAPPHPKRSGVPPPGMQINRFNRSKDIYTTADNANK